MIVLLSLYHYIVISSLPVALASIAILMYSLSSRNDEHPPHMKPATLPKRKEGIPVSHSMGLGNSEWESITSI